MKKLVSVSPVIMLIIPVIMFLGISLAVNKQDVAEDTLTSTAEVNAKTLVNAGKVSIIKYLLK